MKAKALERYPIPAYPTQQEVLRNSKLIERTLPVAVRRLIQTGLSGVMALMVPLNGCDRKNGGQVSQPSSQQVEEQDPNSSRNTPRPKLDQKVLLIAPLFEHGTGRGATGCVVVAPPVFLSEEDAVTIIREELLKYGVDMQRKTLVFTNTWMIRQYPWQESDGPKPLEMDLLDKNGQIVVEYVSLDDYYDLGGVRSMSTAQSFDFKKVAQRLSFELEKGIDRGVFGIFYDPMVSWNMTEFSREASQRQERPNWKQIQVEAKAKAEDLLRQQVQDFAKWLADQKVI